MKKTTALVLTILVCANSASAQKLAVKILDRQDNDTDYTYVVPAHWFSNSNTNVNCGGSDTNVNCNGSTNTTGTITPAHQMSYHVRGATFTLQLPDGRAAIVNCESKFVEHFAGHAGKHRSCRMPLVENEGRLYGSGGRRGKQTTSSFKCSPFFSPLPECVSVKFSD
jgi:hypothetical protein